MLILKKLKELNLSVIESLNVKVLKKVEYEKLKI